MSGRRGKSIIFVSFHFPPIQASSGVLRILSFVKYFAAKGWAVTVVTARAFAYDDVNPRNIEAIPSKVTVRRAWSLNTRKHLSFRGRYPGLLAIPDNWVTWIPFAYVATAIRIVANRPSAVVTTYPIASCHVVGWLVKLTFGIPWIVDFRDPMLQDNYPRGRALRWAYATIERHAVERADMIVVTTPGTKRLMLHRYPELVPRLRVIENGVDLDIFEQAKGQSETQTVPLSERAILLHSGIVYPSERDPTNLFLALARAKSEGIISGQSFELRLRGCRHEQMFGDEIRSLNIGDLVSILPPMSYEEAAKEILGADALLVLQAANCDDQVPAKVYEYLFANKPILGLTNPAGDTGAVLQTAGIEDMARLEDREAVYRVFVSFVLKYFSPERLRLLREPGRGLGSKEHSREGRAQELESSIVALLGS